MKRTALTFAAALCLSLNSYAQTPNNLISPLGNVGIGTLTPSSKLHVVGNSLFSGTMTLTGNAILTGTTTISQLKLSSLNVVINQAGLELLVVDPANGTVAKAGGDVLKELVYSEPAFPCLTPVAPNGQAAPVYPVWANGPSKIFVRCPNDVKVGIGTNNPLTKLDVDGVVRSTGFNVGVNPAEALATVHVRYMGSTPSADKVMIFENSAGRLLQLDNKGLLRAREIKVDVTTWSDFVFAADYPLLTPDEIRAFIAANHHLPGVPSAAEMQENGMDVATMSATLLKKIEELTLLVLEQQRQIDALSSTITK